MEYIISLVLLILTIVLLRFVFKVNIKRIKLLEENRDLNDITDKFPSNIEIAKEMLRIIGNNGVKIEELRDTKTSLYIAITDKIQIADLKDNYSRIQTIAHECMHSIQDRRLLLFNFIFSNINIVYYAAIIILTMFRVINPDILYILILLIFTLIWFSVRGYLEIDAMTKSRFLAKEYIEEINITTEEENEKLLKEYDKINKLGIPFVINYLISGAILKIIIYIIVSIMI